LIDEKDMISSISHTTAFPKVYWRQDIHVVHAPLGFWKYQDVMDLNDHEVV